MDNRCFAAKVYVSPLGIHFQHNSEYDAKCAYNDALSKGRDVILEGSVMVWLIPERKTKPTTSNGRG